jgi:hypothetical protein
MAKTKKAPEAKVPEGTKPRTVVQFDPVNAGEFVAGRFIQFQKDTVGLVIMLTGGAVRLGVVLRQLFLPVYETLREGDAIKITYAGKNGRTKLFELEVNGKKINREREIAIPASKDETSLFFSSAWEFPEKAS